MKKRAICMAIILAAMLSGCGSKPAEEAAPLSDRVPVMDRSVCNVFEFDVSVTAADEYGQSGDHSLSGTIEVQGDISHLYEDGMETWTDHAKGESYTGSGGEWELAEAAQGTSQAKAFASAINNRDAGYEQADGGGEEGAAPSGTCTASWEFEAGPADVFGRLMPDAVKGAGMSGTGRVTAILDPETHELDRFVFTYTATDGGRDGLLLEATVRWVEVNDEYTELAVPSDIAGEAYTKRTGVRSDGYDGDVNPVAESLIESYGGTADVTVYDGGAALFWTAAMDGHSVTVGYAKEDAPDGRFRGAVQFFRSQYGEPAEESDGEAYFYSEGTGELIYAYAGQGRYIEITITGQPGDSQGTLRKPLITYRSKLGL